MVRLKLKVLLNKLDFRLGNRVPVIHQIEGAECGLACLAMVCGYYSKHIDLFTLRQKFNLSSRGTNFSSLNRIADELGLASRALTLDIKDLTALKTPCILHWDFNHFVVLVNVKRKSVTLHDPARGRRIVKFEELSRYFTGVALELWPNSTFEGQKKHNLFNINLLMGKVHGLKKTLGKIFLVSLVVESINLLIPISTQLVMDHAIPAQDVGLLSIICLGLLFFTLLRTVLSAFRSWSSIIMATLINVQWQAGLFNHLMKLPLSYFERRKLGDIQSRFNSLNTLRETFTNSVIGALIDTTMIVGVSIMMILYGGWLTTVVFGFTFLYVLVRISTYRIYRELTEEWLIRDARTRSYFMETLFGIATIKMQGLNKRRSTNWLNLEIDTVNTDIKINKMDMFFTGINSLISSFEQILILWLGINLVIGNNMTIGMFVAFGIFREQFSNRMYSLVNFILRLRMMNLHNERIADIALSEREPKTAEIFFDYTKNSVGLNVESISYRYDNYSSDIFKELSFNVLPGESIAIIGPSGCGKTTLMKVLCGLISPNSGNISIGGYNVQTLGLDNYRKIIGCVMQDDRLFSGSIRDNICGFDDEIDQKRLEECAISSYIHDYILKMPMGYDTLIGELGEGLSGGQKQRIFIARALYRNPKILFMDEATSALDEESEFYVNQAISKLKITRIIIAHRKSTIASADRVISLKTL